MGTPLPAVAFADGEALATAKVVTALEAARTYLNGDLVSADFNNTEIGSEALYRPDIGAVPAPWFDGEFNAIVDAEAGQAPGDLPAPRTDPATGQGFGRVRDRFPIYPNVALLQDGLLPVRGLFVRLTVERTGSVKLFASFFAHTVPDAAGMLAFGGFVLVYKKTSNLNWTEIVGTYKGLTHPEQRHSFTMVGRLNVTAGAEGTYDIGVCYKADAGTSASALQVSVMQRYIKARFLKGG